MLFGPEKDFLDGQLGKKAVWSGKLLEVRIDLVERSLNGCLMLEDSLQLTIGDYSESVEPT